MKQVTVRALKPFEYEGRLVNTGSAVSMRAVDAAVHARKRNVTLTRELKAESPAEEPKPRRRYRRRDLVAEP